MAVFYSLYNDAGVKGLMTPSRLPISLNFIASCSGNLMDFRKQIPEKNRFFVFIIALSPLAVDNQQIISGWFSQPVNFESYFGIYCVRQSAVCSWFL